MMMIENDSKSKEIVQSPLGGGEAVKVTKEVANMVKNAPEKYHERENMS